MLEADAVHCVRVSWCASLPVVAHLAMWSCMQDNEPLMRALSALINHNRPDLVLFVGEALVGNDGAHLHVEQLQLL